MAQRIKQARVFLGLEQKALAQHLQTHERSIQDWEAGKSVPGGRFLAKLCALGINGTWLLLGEGPIGRDVCPEPEVLPVARAAHALRACGKAFEELADTLPEYPGDVSALQAGLRTIHTGLGDILDTITAMLTTFESSAPARHEDPA